MADVTKAKKELVNKFIKYENAVSLYEKYVYYMLYQVHGGIRNCKKQDRLNFLTIPFAKYIESYIYICYYICSFRLNKISYLKFQADIASVLEAVDLYATNFIKNSDTVEFDVIDRVSRKKLCKIKIDKNSTDLDDIILLFNDIINRLNNKNVSELYKITTDKIKNGELF